MASRARLAGSPSTATILIAGTGSVSLRHLDVRNDRNSTPVIKADAAATLADLIVTATGTGSNGVLFGASGNVLRDSFVWTTGPGATSVSVIEGSLQELDGPLHPVARQVLREGEAGLGLEDPGQVPAGDAEARAATPRCSGHDVEVGDRADRLVDVGAAASRWP